MRRRSVFLSLALIIVVASLFSFFMPVIPVNNSSYLPGVPCPFPSSCPMATYRLDGNFHLFVSPTYLLLKNGAVVFNGTYSLRYIPTEA
jgi:hypothetical protein